MKQKKNNDRKHINQTGELVFHSQHILNKYLYDQYN
ncbi:hypothetical protein VR7878_03746 [Vibrio ruber DSM 16370]|uniref:Uncharacterized protein n=1 Tax=Vibrio ruber (strain DSM 16370 / JCM 11486 / BCRC 17186 / CECT 7878 / LMG 23124 / VR1) TaxID=1123498 RepID=A0A1R4LU41_VIBR1|nr:hypothetical protein VR7878_03746 [Vibrio ruber DSM 16370]